MANPVLHFEVMGKDGDALRKFYGDAFGWKIDKIDGPMDYGIVEKSGDGITGGIGSNPPVSYVTFYVQVDDLEGALEKVESLGGKKMIDPMDVPGGGRIAMFSDPEGHTVGLFATS